MRPNNRQLPDYSASPDFFVGPIGLFEIWRSAINHEGVCRTAPATPGLLNILNSLSVIVTSAGWFSQLQGLLQAALTKTGMWTSLIIVVTECD